MVRRFAAEGLRVPLHAECSPAVGGLDGFDDAVGGPGCHLQALSRRRHGLVVEGVDAEARSAGFGHEAAGLCFHPMCLAVARSVLTVLQQSVVGFAGAEVLMNGAAQCRRQHLHAATDAEYGNLTVVAEARQEEFEVVAGGIDASKRGVRLLTYI